MRRNQIPVRCFGVKASVVGFIKVWASGSRAWDLGGPPQHARLSLEPYCTEPTFWGIHILIALYKSSRWWVLWGPGLDLSQAPEPLFGTLKGTLIGTLKEPLKEP